MTEHETNSLERWSELDRLGEIRRQSAEIERLRALLKDIHNDGRCPSWILQKIENGASGWHEYLVK